jgi:hypothetical protein
MRLLPRKRNGQKICENQRNLLAKAFGVRVQVPFGFRPSVLFACSSCAARPQNLLNKKSFPLRRQCAGLNLCLRHEIDTGGVAGGRRWERRRRMRACQPGGPSVFMPTPATIALCPGFAFRWQHGGRKNSCPPTATPCSRRVTENAPRQTTGFPMSRAESSQIVVNRAKSRLMVVNPITCPATLEPSNARRAGQTRLRPQFPPFASLRPLRISRLRPSDFIYVHWWLKFSGLDSLCPTPHARIGP